MIHAVRSVAFPAGWPQRWQNRAWGESSARQALHDRGPRLAPQAVQNLPDGAAAPQAGQVAEEGVVMEG
ncbi:MAG TPA: hypothetical protein VF252_10770 [Gemmatimonadales bacterium]